MKLLRLLPFALLLINASGQISTIPAPQHEANFDAERAQANQLYTAGKILEALPLYEDLCRQDQTLAVFAERHGFGLLRQAATLQDEAAKKAMQQRGLAELYRAQKLGDNSPLLQTVLGDQAKSPLGAALSNIPLTVGYTYRGNAQAVATENDAEAAFAKNDLDTATKLYIKAAAQDPAWYSPVLFTGDMYFRQSKTADAGVWFQKAIAIDPDRETAYRYWADALVKAGDLAAAKVQYENAVIAEPYTRSTWLGLQKYANTAKMTIAQPAVRRPNYTTENGVLKVEPPSSAYIASGHATWLIYDKVRVAHGGMTPVQIIVAGGTSATGVLTPSGYRHSLAEEMDAITQMLAEVRSQVKAGTLTLDALEPSLKILLALQDDKMLEPWILLSAYDAGTRQDYFAYRPAHRELLRAYLDKYVLHAVPAA
jgi:tetratricopeptide (TPR) repeat protein